MNITNSSKRKTVLAGLVGLFAAGGTAQVAAQGGEAATSQSAIDEIIVTARKREESLQDVPMSVSAVSGVEISKLGIENVNNLFGRIPNLHFTNSGTPSQTSDFYYLVIRGVGFNGGEESAVGMFVDGVYQPQIGYDIGFLDLEQLEVLRGPQGSLFGRNTQGGALNLVTKKPTADFEGKAEVEAAEFDTYRAQFSVRGAITDNLFGGLSAEYGSSDGYIENLGSGGSEQNYYDRSTVRGSLRWLPTDNLELIVTGDTSQNDYNEIGQGTPLSCECYETTLDVVEDEKNISGMALSINWDISDTMRLSSISGWRKSDSDISIDFDVFGPLPGAMPVVIAPVPGSTLIPEPVTLEDTIHNQRFEQDILSQEIRISGTRGEEVNWLLGAYYFEQSEDYERHWDIGPDIVIDPSIAYFRPFRVLTDLQQNRDGWAIFGQTSWRPIDRLELTLGGRYASEKSGPGGELATRIETLNFNRSAFISAEDTFDSFTAMGSVAYHFTEQVMTYFTISQGWKSGGFRRAPANGAESIPFDDENSTNYELGLKSTWLDNRLSTNLVLFYVDITGQQLGAVTENEFGIPVTVIDNAGKSRTQGVELELNADLSESLHFGLSLGYVDTEYKDYTDANGKVFDGESFPYVPDLSGSATLEYNLPLQNGMELDFSANYRHIADYRVRIGGFLGGGDQLEVPDQDRVDLQVSLSNGDWRFTAYANNVFDSYDYSNVSLAIYAAKDPANYYSAPLAPRQVGFKVSKNF